MLQQHTSINNIHLQSNNVRVKVTSLLQYTHPDHGPRSGRKYLGTISYVSFINQFLPDTIKSIQQLERTNAKICIQNISVLFNEIYIYIYICVCVYAYVYAYIHVHVCVYIYIYIHMCVHICICIYICVCVYVYTYV